MLEYFRMYAFPELLGVKLLQMLANNFCDIQDLRLHVNRHKELLLGSMVRRIYLHVSDLRLKLY